MADENNSPLNFSGGGVMPATGGVKFATDTENDADEAPVVERKPANAPPAPGLGGMTFGQAIAPNSSKEDQEFIDRTARANEDTAFGHMHTAYGRRAAKAANPELLKITAPKYAELYAIAGKEIDEATQKKIDRLAALENHTARTAGLGIQFQTAPVHAPREIAKLRAELDKDTLQIRTQAQRTEMMKARLQQRQAEDELSDREVGEKFDNFTPRQLQAMLVDESYKKIHPDATRMTIIDKLKEFKDQGDPELAASEMTPERRKAVINDSIGRLTIPQRRELLSMYETDGPMAFVESNHAEKMLPKEGTTPEEIAKYQQIKDAEDARNQRVRLYGRYFGGMTPSFDEVVGSLVSIEEKAAKLNLGPQEVARRERQAREYMRIEVTKADAQLSNMSKLGLTGEAEYVQAHLATLASLEEQEATAKADELPAIREKKAKLIKDHQDSINQRVKALSESKEVQLAAGNFTKTGEVIGKKDGDALLAYSLRNTMSETSQNFYEHTVTTPSGIKQVEQLPLANPTSSALAAMRGQVDRYLQDLNAIDDPALKAELQKIRNDRKQQGKEVGIGEYDDEMYTTVMRHISKTDVGRRSREMYASVAAQQVMTLALNNVIGNNPEDRQLFAEFVKTEPRGTVLNDRYLTKSANNSVLVPNMKAIADRLVQVNRLDVLERMQGQFTNPESMKQFVDKLAPRTLVEKAMFAHMFGNTASVTLSSAGTGIGRLHFSQYLARNVIGSIDKAIVEEKVAAPKRVIVDDPAKAVGFDYTTNSFKPPEDSPRSEFFKQGGSLQDAFINGLKQQ